MSSRDSHSRGKGRGQGQRGRGQQSKSNKSRPGRKTESLGDTQTQREPGYKAPALPTPVSPSQQQPSGESGSSVRTNLETSTSPATNLASRQTVVQAKQQTPAVNPSRQQQQQQQQQQSPAVNPSRQQQQQQQQQSPAVNPSRQQQQQSPAVNPSRQQQQQQQQQSPAVNPSRQQQQQSPAVNPSRQQQQQQSPAVNPSRQQQPSPAVNPSSQGGVHSSHHPQKEQIQSTVLKGPVNYYGLKQPPERPGFGTSGRKTTVRSNFYCLTLPHYLTIYQYDVSIAPGSKLPKWLTRLIYQNLETRYSADIFGKQRGAFDGSKLVYCSKRLSLEGDRMELPVDVQAKGEERTQSFIVTIQQTATINFDSDRIRSVLSDDTERQPLLQALDVILRHQPSMTMETVDRSFYSRPPRPYNLGWGLEVWPGYYQSVRPTTGGEFKVNIDISSKAFYTPQPAIAFMCLILRDERGRTSTRPLTREEIVKWTRAPLKEVERKLLSKAIIGVKVKVTHLPYPRKYTVVGVTQMSANELTFSLDNGETTSVGAYFKEKYPNSPLLYSHLPCLQVGQKSKKIFIPMDVCEIVEGQRYNKKLNEQQTAQMIRHITKPADEREREISQKFTEANISDDPVLREFGIGVNSRMSEMRARVIDPPALIYSREKAVKPPKSKGAWEMQQNTQFYKGIEVDGYAVLVGCQSCSEQSVRQFVKLLEKRGREMGMLFKGEPLFEFHNPYQRGAKPIEKVLNSLQKDVSLIIAVIDKGPIHDEIKRIGDTTEASVATQCVASDTVNNKCNATVAGNICLKINAKLGGVNQIVDPKSRPLFFQREPTIVFGADVSHPSIGDASSPSIASVVASMDRTASMFKAEHHSQKHRQEIIEDLKEMTKKQLISFYKANGKTKPSRVLFYRDGVSEGQFEEVRKKEVAAVQWACSELEEDYHPRITFIVVQKRHHTRFFPVDPRDKNGRGNNIPPGTVVEHGIVHPTEYDFYLCSHAAIQGTSSPCHYHILWDDSNLSADELQILSYQFCHTYYRCNRSVSYPAPAYYAHRDAAHTRGLLHAHEDHMTSDGGSSSAHQGQLSLAEQDEAIHIHPNRQGTMYFM